MANLCTENIVTDPMKRYNIFSPVPQAGGFKQSACINAVTLALIAAGIISNEGLCEWLHSVTFINDRPLMDINYQEESFGGPQLSSTFLQTSENILMFQVYSWLHVDNLESKNYLNYPSENAQIYTARRQV